MKNGPEKSKNAPEDLKIRAFLALRMDPCVIELLEEAQDRLRGLLGGGKRKISWARPRAIHLTLKFLGDVDAASVEDIAAAAERAASGCPPLELALGPLGGFPKAANPRVVWAGIEENPGLTALQERLEEELKTIGFEPEGRKFRPHLTLCRVKSNPDGRDLGRILKNYRGEQAGEAFTADKLDLIKSELNPTGARYTILKTVELKD